MGAFDETSCFGSWFEKKPVGQTNWFFFIQVVSAKNIEHISVDWFQIWALLVRYSYGDCANATR